MKDLSISESLRENYADYYEQGASFIEWRRLGAIDKAANIVALCEPRPSSVLEIGCGDGAIIERLVSLGHWERDKVIGLEISPSALKVLAAKGIKSQIFAGYRIPYPESSFDLVVLSHVIEHVEHPRQLLYEAKRVGRQVFVEVPLEDNQRMPADFVFDRVGHINFYNPKTIRRLIQSCGLTILRSRLSHSSLAAYRFQKGYKGALNYWIKEALLRFAPGFAMQRFTYHYSLLSTTSTRFRDRS